MFSVILADDEPLVLDGLECIIPWKKLGFEIKGKAYDGEELIKLVDKYHPAVVVTDIQMPVYTGLECISIIRNINPETKILILSGYATFEYAKTAMSYGIIGYILKPINKKELIDFLIRIKEIIEREKKQSTFRSIALNDMMREYLDGNLPGKTLKDIFNFFEIGKIPSSFIIVAIEPLLLLSEDREKIRKIILYIENLVDKTDAGIFIPYSESLILLLIYNKNYLENDQRSIKDLIDEIKKNCFMNFSIAIRTICSSIVFSDEVRESFYNIRASLMRDDDVSKIEKEITSLFICIEDGIGIGAVDDMEYIISLLVLKLSGLSCMEAGSIYSSFIYSLRQKYGQKLCPEIFSFSSIYMSQHWWQTRSSIAEMNEILKTVIKLCIKNMQIELQKHSVTESMIEDISHYVEKNYCTVTRGSVAEYFNVNPSYLSQSFQKYKGVSFIDFVTEVRIKNAKRLLQTTNMKIQVIAEEVGYSSAQHFAKIFKKSTGIMPSTFRENLFTI
ncbi:response regulator [Treponema sp. OMZ 840]|uniref:response regulator transcription factor n=1 Tax=Treponema sp. OMZ 840 TaxID=244313 RepID=UPI003D91A711